MDHNEADHLLDPLIHSLTDSEEESTFIESLLSQETIPWARVAKAAIIEFKKLWILSRPSIIVSVLNFMLSAISQMFAGHLGELQLAGASIASVGIQGLAYGIMLGMATAVQTVCGQAYGAKQYSMLGVICQRSNMIIMTATALLLVVFYFFADPLLVAIGQGKEIAAAGAIFSRGLIPQLFAFAINCPMQRFLQAQNIVSPLAYISVGTFLLHILLTWVGVEKLGFGLLEAALILSLSWWILVIATASYIFYSPLCKYTWTGFTSKAFTGLWSYFKLTVASAFMLTDAHYSYRYTLITFTDYLNSGDLSEILDSGLNDNLCCVLFCPTMPLYSLEIWYTQGLVLISGLLPNSDVALDSISVWYNKFILIFNIADFGTMCTMNYYIWDLMLMLGLSTAARFSVIIVVVTCFIISIILVVGVLVLKKELAMAFTVFALTPLLAISIFLNGTQPILSGVAIGCGCQAMVAYVNLATYYCVGLPIGIVLGFKANLGVDGI